MGGRLSSDVLEAQFGPTHVEVLRQDESERIIRTIALENNKILEISQVQFITEGIKRVPEAHQTVLEGQSMGKAFRAAGLIVARSMYAGFKYHLSANFEGCFQSKEAATVMGIKVLVGPEQTPYADVLETYHPDVDWGKLKMLEPDQVLRERIKLLDNFLATL